MTRQEASYDMTFSAIEPGLPIECFGLHREKPRLRLSVPHHQPHFEFNANGKLAVEPARLHQIVCYPDEERCTLVFSARHPLTTAFIPGVQRGYDLSVRIDRSSPIHYDPPPPPPSQLEAAKGAS